MTTLQFLAEWTLRSSILILSGALLLWALRVKDPSMRLAAWIAMLCGSAAMPLFLAVAPRVPVPVMRSAPRPAEAPVAILTAAPELVREVPQQKGDASKPFDWARTAVMVYFSIAVALLLRLCFGLAMSLRLLRGSQATGQKINGVEIRESEQVAAPLTLGIAHPAIVLPIDWREWDSAKLDAVLAHESSHVRRYDPAVQLLSAIHRSLLWHNPLSWFLHQRLVRVAEEVSDDAAVAAIDNRTLYAEVLLDFMQRGVREAGWQGVPMARYGRADQRIHRILDGTALARGVTRWSMAAVLTLAAPLAYLVAAVKPQSAPQPQAAPTAIAPLLAELLPAQAAPAKTTPPPASPKPAAAAKRESDAVYLFGLGNVSPSTVTVKPRVDGQLMSLSFKEGGLVEAGQVLASIDPRPYEIELEKAQGQLDQDQNQLPLLELQRSGMPSVQFDSLVAPIKGKMKADQANVDAAKLQLSYTQVRAPIAGVAGLRLVDPGNIVHATDSTGIVVIIQLQPISVLFTIPEDKLPQVLGRVRQNQSTPVEAWNRDSSVKIATGQLTAVDNQIDETTGTAKLKAVFENKDGALYPNEFVNVRLLLSK